MYSNWTTPQPTPRQLLVLREAQLRTGTSQRAQAIIPAWRRALEESGAHVVGRRGHGPFYVIAACVVVPAVTVVLLTFATLTAP
ncbi:hypothetical protein [Leifsonia virtsii]|uniref:Uncharacterized protein n=1 Tax=Leifsonia virtsii TaxID=3035915 RepID=A0ABT8IXI6_9MICO|nr:hypothetical protein [Leifsonia virtsii]MDN4597533.1 hypothetical protein [Leifsonia virtsii]